ncbi:MAG: hypothetical protein WBA17_15365 [Saprospiraceae bacterium]
MKKRFPTLLLFTLILCSLLSYGYLLVEKSRLQETAETEMNSENDSPAIDFQLQLKRIGTLERKIMQLRNLLPR